jgi:hypothetical protein
MDDKTTIDIINFNGLTLSETQTLLNGEDNTYTYVIMNNAHNEYFLYVKDTTFALVDGDNKLISFDFLIKLQEGLEKIK